MELSLLDLAALHAIDGGADILSRSLATQLRALAGSHPSLLTITQRMGTYKATEQLPFFGAILSTEGRDELAAHDAGELAAAAAEQGWVSAGPCPKYSDGCHCSRCDGYDLPEDLEPDPVGGFDPSTPEGWDNSTGKE